MFTTFSPSSCFKKIGVWVHFDDFLLEQYGIVLVYFYEHALRRAYKPDDNLLPREAIEQVLKQHKLINMESFLGYFYLWQSHNGRGLPHTPYLNGMVSKEDPILL